MKNMPSSNTHNATNTGMHRKIFFPFIPPLSHNYLTALKNMPWFHSSFRYPPATIKTLLVQTHWLIYSSVLHAHKPPFTQGVICREGSDDALYPVCRSCLRAFIHQASQTIVYRRHLPALADESMTDTPSYFKARHRAELYTRKTTLHTKPARRSIYIPTTEASPRNMRYEYSCDCGRAACFLFCCRDTS